METIRTGLDFLDQEIHGFCRSKPYLVFGSRGSGKSSLGVQYAAAGLERGERVLYVYHGRGEELLALAASLGLHFESYLENETLILVEVDDEVRTLVQQRGPEVALDALRQQFTDVKIERVVFDPVNVFFSELHNEALLRADIWAITNRLAPLDWTPLLLWDHDESNTQTTALRVFSEECWGLFELRTTPEADTLTEVDRQHTHNFIVYKLREAQLSRRRFQLRLSQSGFHGTDPALETDSATYPFTRFRTFKTASDEPSEVAQTSKSVDTKSPTSTKAIHHLETVSAPKDIAAKTDKKSKASTATSKRSAASPSKKPTPEQLAALEGVTRAAIAPRKAGQPDKEALESLPDRRAVVLIVDDDTISRQMAIDAIGQDWDVLEASNAVDGLELALTKHPDILLLDVVLPRTSGPELCGTLRELGVNAPIIFLSARLDQPQVKSRCFELGGTDTIAKPFEAKKLRSKIRRHITESLINPATWPEINLEDAKHRLGQKEVGLPSLENRLARALQKAQSTESPIALLGYEFRFVTGNEGHAFVEHFVHVLNKAIGQNDDLCRTSERRLVVVLYGANREMARSVVQRAHRKMKSAATLLVGRATVKPKALFRLLHLSPTALQSELPTPQELVRKLFQQPAHLIEEEGEQKPGEPMEKYPLLEAVFFALRSDSKKCTSPLNGAQYFVETLRPSGVRKVTIGEYVYRTQDPSEPTPASARQRDGHFIVWVIPQNAPERVVARIEDERVFREG